MCVRARADGRGASPYLSGGAALSAFYLHRRQSLAVDLFVPTVDARHALKSEFGRPLSTYNGWGMRFMIVPDDEIGRKSEARVWRK